MGEATRVLMAWRFRDSSFMNIQALDRRHLSPELTRLVESSKEFESLEEFAEFRKSLLEHACTASDYESIIVSQLVRMTLIFLTSPLSDTEIEQLRQIRIDEDTKAQLIFHASNQEIIEFNKKILPIFTTMPCDIPSIDTSDMPLMCVNLIASLMFALMKSSSDLDAPILIKAAKNFFVAAPKFLFADDRRDLINFSNFISATFDHVDADYIQLFYESLNSRFNYEMARDWFLNLVKTGACKNNQQLLAMTGAIIMNKQTHGDLSPNGKIYSKLITLLSLGDKADMLWFLRNLDLKRLLFKMNSIYQELYPAPGSLHSSEDIKRIIKIFEAMSAVLMEHLIRTLHAGNAEQRLTCMLIEYITAWTDSPVLMVNLALRWVTFTENSEVAIKVVDRLMDLISQRPDLLSEQTAGLSENLFLKKTCAGVIFPGDKCRFADKALKAKKRHVALLGPSRIKPETVPDGVDVLEIVTDSRVLSTFFTSLYFNTPYAGFGILTRSYYNVCSDELPDRNFPKHASKIARIQCTTIGLKNEQYVSWTKLAISQSKFYACKDIKQQARINGHEMEYGTANNSRKSQAKNHLYQIVLKNNSRKRNFEGEEETAYLSHGKQNLIVDVSNHGSSETDENSNLTVKINP